MVEVRREYGSAKDGNANMVLDDVAASRAVKDQTGALVESAFSSTHDGLSVVVITQQFTSIAKPFRENLSHLVFLNSSNKKDLCQMLDEFLGFISPKEKKRIIKVLSSTPFARLELQLIPPPVKYKLVYPK